jgi:HK97 family phage portal protein
MVMMMNNEVENLVHDIARLETKSSSLSQVVQNDLTGAWQTDDTTALDPHHLKALFESEDWVYIVVDLIAMKISSQALRVMRQVIEDGVASIEPAEDHPLQAVLDRPNEFQDYHSWMYVHVVDLTLTGNGIQWVKEGPSWQIFNIPTESVQIDFDSVGNITRYVSYEVVDKDGFPVKRTNWIFNPANIIHVRRPNPGSMIWGLSPFIPGQRCLLFNRWSQEYLNGFYQKGASPSMALELSQDANETHTAKLLRSFEMAYTGRRNQRRTMILPKGVTAKPMSHSLADQQLKDYIAQNRETILALLKVPPHEVGIQKAGSLGSEEYKTALKNFWASTLKPTMRLIAGTMTHAFRNALGKDHFLEFDLSDVDILQEDKKAKADLATVMLNTRTLNETREDVWADPPLEGGDSLPGKPAAPAIPFSQFSADPVQVTKDLPMPSNSQKEKADHFLKANSSWFDKRESNVRRVTGKSEPAIYKASVELFGDQVVKVIPAVKKYLDDEKGYISAKSYLKTDGVGKRISWATKAKIKDRKKVQKAITEALNSLKDQWKKDYTAALDETIDLGYDVALDIPFDFPDKDTIQAAKERGAKDRRLTLAARGLATFDDMTKTSTEEIMAIIDKGIEGNKTINEIARSIADKFANVENIDSRAQTIARTEVLTAVSLGQAAAMQDAAKVVPDLQKMWLTAQDDRVRGLKSTDKKSHAEMHGQIRKSAEPFTEPLTGEEVQYPRAPGSTPGMAINCRCTWIMLPAKEMSKINESDITADQTTEG